MSWASGNRDERHFERPQVIDLGRVQPRSHFSFGVFVRTLERLPVKLEGAA